MLNSYYDWHGGLKNIREVSREDINAGLHPAHGEHHHSQSIYDARNDAHLLAMEISVDYVYLLLSGRLERSSSRYGDDGFFKKQGTDYLGQRLDWLI